MTTRPAAIAVAAAERSAVAGPSRRSLEAPARDVSDDVAVVHSPTVAGTRAQSSSNSFLFF